MAKKSARKPTGAAAIKSVDDEPTLAIAQVDAPVADKPGLGKKFCPHCHAKIAARASTCPECHKPIAPKVKKSAKAPRQAPAGDQKRQLTAASNGTVKPQTLDAAVRFLKEAGSLDETEKAWQIIRKVAGAISTPF